MTGIVRVVAEGDGVAGAVADALRAAFAPGDGADVSATLLVTMTQAADTAMDAAAAFARADGVAERLVVHLWHRPAAQDWEAARQAAIMVAFTRHAAFAWAGLRVRVNAVTMASPDGAHVLHAELAATVRAVWRWPSMTGQVIDLAPVNAWPAFLPRAG